MKSDNNIKKWFSIDFKIVKIEGNQPGPRLNKLIVLVFVLALLMILATTVCVYFLQTQAHYTNILVGVLSLRSIAKHLLKSRSP